MQPKLLLTEILVVPLRAAVTDRLFAVIASAFFLTVKVSLSRLGATLFAMTKLPWFPLVEVMVKVFC